MLSARAGATVGAAMLAALATLVAGYAVWSFANVQQAVQEAVAAGQLALPGGEYDVASFAMSSSGQYAILAVVLFALGWLVWRSRPSAEAVAQVRRVGAPASAAPEEDELDELLAGMEGDGTGR